MTKIGCSFKIRWLWSGRMPGDEAVPRRDCGGSGQGNETGMGSRVLPGMAGAVETVAQGASLTGCRQSIG